MSGLFSFCEFLFFDLLHEERGGCSKGSIVQPLSPRAQSTMRDHRVPLDVDHPLEKTNVIQDPDQTVAPPIPDSGWTEAASSHSEERILRVIFEKDEE